MKKEIEIFKISILAFSFTLLFATMISFGGFSSKSELIFAPLILLSTLMIIIYLVTIIKEINRIFEKV